MPVFTRNVVTMVGAGASHAIQHFGHKAVEYMTEGANLTLKYHVSGVRFPIVSVSRKVEAGCVVHFEKGHSFAEFQHCRREWIWLLAKYAEKNSGERPDVVCTVDGERQPLLTATRNRLLSSHDERLRGGRSRLSSCLFGTDPDTALLAKRPTGNLIEMRT